MAKTYIKLTRPAIRKLAPGEKINEHGITFERQANGDACLPSTSWWMGSASTA